MPIEEADKYIKKMLKNKPDSLQGLVYFNLGNQCQQSRGEDAIYFYRKSLVLTQTKQFEKIGEIYRKIAITYYYLGEYINAFDNIKKAINYYSKTQNSDYLAKCYVNIGEFYRQIGEYEKAENMLKYSINLAKSDNQKVMSYIAYGALLSNTKQYDEAIKFNLLAQNLLPKADPRNYIIHNNLGTSYLRAEKYNKALAYLYKAAHGITFENNSNYLTIYDNIGIAHLKLGQTSIAQKILENNLQIVLNNKLQLDGSTYYQSLAVLKLHNKDTLSALHIIQKAIISLLPKFKPKNDYQNPTFSEINPNVVLKLYDYLLFKLALLPKNSQIEILSLTDSLIDLMRNEHTEQGSKLFWREKTHSFYEQAIETCFQLKNYQKAFYFIEKSRAILLLDALKAIDARQVLSQEQQQEEQDLRYSLIGFQNKLASLNENSKEYTETLNNVIATQEKYQQFIKVIEKTNPSYYQLKYGTSYLSLSDLQAKLKTTNQAFITFFSGEKYTYILFISPTDVRWKQLPTAEISADVQTYLSLVSKDLSTAEWKQFQTLSFRLYQQFFTPFAISQERIIVSADNFSIPFEALLTKDNGMKNNFLIHHHSFSYAYSANVHFKELPSRFSIYDRLLGVAPVNYNPKLKVTALKEADVSLNKIEANYFGGKKLIENEATKALFLSKLPDYQIIQLFTHGTSLGKNEQPTIYFNDDVLALNELYGLQQIAAKLVVLSACETGIGKTADGEGIQSMARGFSFLGVPSLVSTLWSVDNKATYLLTESFYKYLAKGKPKDEALRLAKTDYLNNEAMFMPYYWAGMVLIGAETPLKTLSYWWIVLGLGLVVLLFLVYKHFLKKRVAVNIQK